MPGPLHVQRRQLIVLHDRNTTADRVPDAPPGNWVDRLAPAAAKPYLRLARFDRPIGAWLLLFPAWWSQALAELSLGRPWPSLWYLLLFLVGAFVDARGRVHL